MVPVSGTPCWKRWHQHHHWRFSVNGWKPGSSLFRHSYPELIIGSDVSLTTYKLSSATKALWLIDWLIDWLTDKQRLVTDLHRVVDRVHTRQCRPTQQPRCSSTMPWSSWLVVAQHIVRIWTPGSSTTLGYLCTQQTDRPVDHHTRRRLPDP